MCRCIMLSSGCYRRCGRRLLSVVAVHDMCNMCMWVKRCSSHLADGEVRKGLHDCNSPMCTLSQNGYGDSGTSHFMSLPRSSQECRCVWCVCMCVWTCVPLKAASFFTSHAGWRTWHLVDYRAVSAPNLNIMYAKRLACLQQPNVYLEPKWLR